MAVIRYTSLNDAALYDGGLLPGTTEVWYFRNRMGQHMIMGLDWMKANRCGYFPNPLNLGMTHILLGRVAETNKERLARVLQADVWSPRGEAKKMLARMAVKHTSLSVGDIIVVEQKAYFVDIREMLFIGYVDRDPDNLRLSGDNE